MTGIQSGEPSQVDLLIALNRLEAKVEAYMANSARSDQTLQSLQVEVAGLRDRVVSMESSRKAAPPWWTVVGGIASLATVVALVLVVADQLYGK